MPTFNKVTKNIILIYKKLLDRPSNYANLKMFKQLECGPMPNLMVALPNIGGALC